MALTFLQLVQQAANELGIPEPSQVFGATDDQSKQLLALSVREGKEFSQMANKNGGWQILHKEYTFLTVGTTAQTGNVVQGSPIITGLVSTVGVTAGMVLTVGGTQTTNLVASVDSATKVTMTSPVTVDSEIGISIGFGIDNYAFPSDLEYFIDKTFWDGSYRWQLLGPLEAQEKNVIRYGISPVGPRRRFWILNNRLWINPAPTNNTDFIAYDYYSNAWCLDQDGVTRKTQWGSDMDTYLLDEDCFILGLKYRFLRAKGLDYTEEYATYAQECMRVMSRDAGGRDLPLNAQATGIYLLSDANCPDTGFGT